MLLANEREGIEKYQAGDYAGASKSLEAVLQTRSDWEEGWRYLGFAQYAQQKLLEATVSLGKAVALDPNIAETRYGLGLVWAAQGSWDQAVACYDETIRLDPNHAGAKQALIHALVTRATVLIHAQDYGRAEYDLDRAMKLDRTAPGPLLVLVNHYIALNERARASRALEQALHHVQMTPEVEQLAQTLGVQVNDFHRLSQQKNQNRQAVQKVQEVPCPACKRPMMEWAVICPHCGQQVKNRPSAFADLRNVRTTVWQDIAYPIMVVLWIIVNALPLVAWLIARNSLVENDGLVFLGYFAMWGGLKVLLGIGALFQAEWAIYLMKIFCYLNVLSAGLGMFMGFGTGDVLRGVLEVVSLSLTCFMIYLLNYMGGD